MSGDGGQGERRGLSGRLPALAVTVASPLILYCIVRAAAASSSPVLAVAAAGLPPQDPTPMLKQMLVLSQQPKLSGAASMLAAAKQGLAKMPLAHEPFFIASRVADQAGDRPRALALMEEARRRRATYAPIRMQLLVYYIEAERYSEALTEIDVLMRRNEELRKLLLPEITKLIANPLGRQALGGMLSKDPEWRADFFGVAGGQKINPRDARALFESVRARNPKHDLALERQLILQAQASTGDFAGARTTWLAGLPAAERSRHGLVFDGTFSGLRAPKPFGWEYQQVDVGRAEPSRDGGRSYLDVAYFGGRAVTLAEQVLALRPGRYTLRVTARTDAPIANGSLGWKLKCLPGDTDLAALDLTRAGQAARPFAVTFVVPASGCPGQKLLLWAEPGDVASVVNLQLSGLEVVR